MIPLSTAMWDPKWYHEGQKQNHWFIDKHNVINGLRAEPFILPLEQYQELEYIDKACGKDCGQSAPNCYFMKNYEKYLDTLDIDDIIYRCKDISKRVQAVNHFEGEPEIVFIVHEPKTCDCAERPVIQKWFRKHGINVTEWEKPAEQLSMF